MLRGHRKVLMDIEPRHRCCSVAVPGLPGSERARPIETEPARNGGALACQGSYHWANSTNHILAIGGIVLQYGSSLCEVFLVHPIPIGISLYPPGATGIVWLALEDSLICNICLDTLVDNDPQHLFDFTWRPRCATSLMGRKNREFERFVRRLPEIMFPVSDFHSTNTRPSEKK